MTSPAKTITLILLAFTALEILPTSARAENKSTSPYFRLYDAITVRRHPNGKQFGANNIEPLLWLDSRFLLEGESHQEFVAALDGFLALSDEEVKRHSPIQRALMQRALWAVFDWSIETKVLVDRHQHRVLQRKLATAIMQVALSVDAIHSLPNTVADTVKSKRYDATHDPKSPYKPFFPRDLFAPQGDWICSQPGHGSATAEMHGDDARWRSAFTIFVSLPGGRDATLKYIRELEEFKTPWTTTAPTGERLKLLTMIGPDAVSRGMFAHPDTPQIPDGTRFALARHALLISSSGVLVASPIVESVQLRVCLNRDEYLINQLDPAFAVAKFVIEPRKLLAGRPGILKAVPKSKIGYEMFMRRDRADPFEDPRRSKLSFRVGVENCAACHSGGGILSIASRNQLFRPKTVVPPVFRSGAPSKTFDLAIRNKTKHASWTLLQSMIP